MLLFLQMLFRQWSKLVLSSFSLILAHQFLPISMQRIQLHFLGNHEDLGVILTLYKWFNMSITIVDFRETSWIQKCFQKFNWQWWITIINVADINRILDSGLFIDKFEYLLDFCPIKFFVLQPKQSCLLKTH